MRPRRAGCLGLAGERSTDATNATGAPDHATRLRAVEQVSTWLQFKRAELPGIDAGRPPLTAIVFELSLGDQHRRAAPGRPAALIARDEPKRSRRRRWTSSRRSRLGCPRHA